MWLRSKWLLWLGVCSAVACQQVPWVTLSLCHQRHCWRNHTQCLYRDLGGEVNSAFCTHMAASPRGFSNLIAEARSCHGDSGEPGHKFSVCMQLGSKGRKRPPPLLQGGLASCSIQDFSRLAGATALGRAVCCTQSTAQTGVSPRHPHRHTQNNNLASNCLN